MEHTMVFTDGAAKGNPGPGGFGAVIRMKGMVTEIGGMSAHTTNNEMELRAVVEALRVLQDSSVPIALYTDSTYVVEGAQKWIFGWMKNGWKTKTGDPVRNKALWQKLAALLPTVRITWHKVPGHAGIPGNERADVIASAFGSGKRPALYRGPEEKYAYDVADTSYDPKKKSDRSSARARQAQKAYSYVSLRDGVVETHRTWVECEARVKGHSRVRFKKALSAADEADIMRTFRSAI